MVELETLLSEVGGELAEVLAGPGVNAGVKHKVSAALSHQLHPPTPPLLGHQAHHMWRQTNFC